MPETQIWFYTDAASGRQPCKDWLLSLPVKARAAGIARLKLLHQFGWELNRPQAAYLRDNIYELRWSSERSQYRILYFFYEKQAIVLSHGIVKKTNKVPEADIELAVKRKTAFQDRFKKESTNGK